VLCDTIRELIDVMRTDSVGAKNVRCSDLNDLSWIGFVVEYTGGTVTNNATIEAVKKWDGCPYVGRLLSTPSGRKKMARCFQKGDPFHEGCGHCLASEVMES